MKRTSWNANMGGKKHTAMPDNQMGPLPTMQFYRQRRSELQDQLHRGKITNVEMMKQLRELRGIIDNDLRAQ